MIPPPPDWLSPQQRYLVGVSGGRDSICLLHWLNQHGFKDLIVCHLNHQLREDEAERDANFVQNLGFPCEVGEIDVSAYRTEHSLSIETAARDCRHDFFRTCAEMHHCSDIILAHHADDQAETILFNLLRGSGGLKGMSAQQDFGELTFLRPLLGVRRSEIDHYLAEHEIEYCEDSSNKDKFATRNRFRHEVIPLLKDILSRDPVPALLRAAEHTNPLENVLEDFDLLDPQGRLYLPSLRNLPHLIQREALYRFLKKEQIPDISTALVDRALAIIPIHAPPALTLPGGLRVRRKESRLFISE